MTPSLQNLIEAKRQVFWLAILVAGIIKIQSPQQSASLLFAQRRVDGVAAFSARMLLRNTPACPGPHHCGGNSRRVRESSGFWPHARPVRAWFIFGSITKSRGS